MRGRAQKQVGKALAHAACKGFLIVSLNKVYGKTFQLRL